MVDISAQAQESTTASTHDDIDDLMDKYDNEEK